MPDDHRACAVDSVADFLSIRTGLDFSGSRGNWLRDFLVASQHPHDEGWGDRLAGGDCADFERLCDVATVQESYFFRERASLEVLRERVLPTLHERAGDVRVWSAGCAGGEETYTLALMLAQAGLATRSLVLGTDLARVAVAAARRGFYGPWSLRGVDKATVDRCFVRSENGFSVPAQWRAPVRFEQHNLISGSVPGRGPFDIVLCRNVLIYLTPDAVRTVGDLLARSLRPGGVLVTGVADPALADVDYLVQESSAGGTVYRRIGEVAPAAENVTARRATEKHAAGRSSSGPARHVAHAAADLRPRVPSVPVRSPSEKLGRQWPKSAEHSLLMAEPREAERLARAALRDTGDRRRAHAVLIRALAGDARLTEALGAAERAVAECALDAQLHGLHASVLLEAGRAPEARDAARRALYLDRDDALAHLVLARAAELLGDPRTATRARRHGHRLLAHQERA